MSHTRKKSKEVIDSTPFEVNFDKGEIYTGGSRTNLRYLVFQGGGLYLYVYSYIFEDLKKQKKVVVKWAINKSGLRLAELLIS